MWQIGKASQNIWQYRACTFVTVNLFFVSKRFFFWLNCGKFYIIIKGTWGKHTISHEICSVYGVGYIMKGDFIYETETIFSRSRGSGAGDYQPADTGA